jgi:uncharacterized protein (TIGR04255 family)
MGDNKIILANGPLVALLIQIQFSPILQISKYIPSIQDELRRKGFPLFKQVEGEGVPPFEGNYEQWMFIANDYSKNIVLDNQKITYQVFDCGTYSCENYAKDFIAIINSFNHTVDISSIIRIGLRWVNSIPEKENLSWKELLKEDFHGMEFSPGIDWFGVPLVLFSVQRGVKLEVFDRIISNFHLNIYQHPNGLKYPQDIMKFPLQEEEVHKGNPLVTFVDLDNNILFEAVEMDDVFTKIEDLLRELSKTIEEVFFKSLITDKAKELWQ